jgi:hypothetical protein
MKQVVVLAHATDAGAASVAGRLRRQLGPASVMVLRPEALSLARWSHRVDEQGHAFTRISLPGMPPLSSADVGILLNRIRYLPVARFRHSSAKDRDYAGAEMEALVASWLAELGDRAVHVVRSHPWVTPSIPVQRWASVAAAHGLPVAPHTITTSERWRSLSTVAGAAPRGEAMACTESALVAGDEVEGPLSERFGAECIATAHALRCFPLLEFHFAKGVENLVAVDPMPPLERAAAVEATCRLVTARLPLLPAAP